MDFILTERRGRVATIILNRPQVLNAWHAPMRAALIEAIEHAGADDAVGALVITGAGTRAFSAGQDLAEAKHFDADRAEEWVGEWERLYDCIRACDKPIVGALNGVAAGSAFQVALLFDFRVAHPGVTMGQPEINAGITSTTGPWIMKEMLGLARTIDLTLTGRLMDAEEARAIGLINRIVPAEQVRAEAEALAADLAAKPPVAMRLNKQHFRGMTEAGFRDCLEAGIRNQRESYASGEPARMMEAFLAARGQGRKAGA